MSNAIICDVHLIAFHTWWIFFPNCLFFYDSCFSVWHWSFVFLKWSQSTVPSKSSLVIISGTLFGACGRFFLNASKKKSLMSPSPRPPVFFPSPLPFFMDRNCSVISRRVLLICRSGRFWKVFLHSGHWQTWQHRWRGEQRRDIGRARM